MDDNSAGRRRGLYVACFHGNNICIISVLIVDHDWLEVDKAIYNT